MLKKTIEQKKIILYHKIYMGAGWSFTNQQQKMTNQTKNQPFS
jgi:hypothetical protein